MVLLLVLLDGNNLHMLNDNAYLISDRTDSCHAQLSNMELSFDENRLSFDAAYSQPILQDSQDSHLQPSKLAMLGELRLISNELIITPRDRMAPDRRTALGYRLLASDRSMLKYVHGANNSSI
jgi:hypothetical protein